MHVRSVSLKVPLPQGQPCCVRVLPGATCSTEIFASRISELCIQLQNQGLSKQLEGVQD